MFVLVLVLEFLVVLFVVMVVTVIVAVIVARAWCWWWFLLLLLCLQLDGFIILAVLWYGDGWCCCCCECCCVAVVKEQTLMHCDPSLRAQLCLLFFCSSVVPQSERILSLRLRQQVNFHVAEAVCSAYECLWAAIHDPTNGYTNPASMVPHSVDSVKKLLQLE